MNLMWGIELLDMTQILKKRLSYMIKMMREKITKKRIEFVEYVLLIISNISNKYPSVSLHTFLFLILSVFYWLTY